MEAQENINVEVLMCSVNRSGSAIDQEHYLKASPMPPAIWFLACCSLDVFCDFSAEICVGSLVSGCSFGVMCFTIHGDLGRGCCQFWCPKRNVSFGMLVASSMIPWGPSSGSGGLGSTRRETLWSRFGFLSILDGSRDRHSRVFG